MYVLRLPRLKKKSNYLLNMHKEDEAFKPWLPFSRSLIISSWRDNANTGQIQQLQSEKATEEMSQGCSWLTSAKTFRKKRGHLGTCMEMCWWVKNNSCHSFMELWLLQRLPWAWKTPKLKLPLVYLPNTWLVQLCTKKYRVRHIL